MSFRARPQPRRGRKEDPSQEKLRPTDDTDGQDFMAAGNVLFDVLLNVVDDELLNVTNDMSVLGH